MLSGVGDEELLSNFGSSQSLITNNLLFRRLGLPPKAKERIVKKILIGIAFVCAVMWIVTVENALNSALCY